MARISKEQQKIIEKKMNGLNGKAARIQAQSLANQFGCDISRIYFYSREVRDNRKQRIDKGTLRCVSDADFDKLAYYTINHDFSGAHLVNEIVPGNDLPSISLSTYNRHLRRQDLSRRQARIAIIPFRNWEAERPNQIHQIDTTVAQQFYIDYDEGGKIGWESPRRHYKNKPGNLKQRLTLFALVDDYSRARFAMFIPGNHTCAWMTALYEAWRTKDNSYRFPFCGLPEIIYADNDSVVKSGKFKKAMEFLRVEIKKHGVENSQAKGKVENSIKILQEFEKISKIRKFDNLRKMNEALWDFLIYLNNREHCSTGEIPFKRWLQIGPEAVRDIPNEDIRRYLNMDEDTRRINGNLTIHLNGMLFQLPRRKPFIDYVGKYVVIYWYPGDISKIFVVLDNKDYEVEFSSHDTHQAGEFRAVEEPTWLKRKREIEEMDDPGLQLYGFYDKQFGRDWIPREAQKFDNEVLAAEMPSRGTMRTPLWFTSRLQEEYLIETPPAPEERAWVETIFEGREEMLEKELEDLIRKVRSGDIEIPRRASGTGVA